MTIENSKKSKRSEAANQVRRRTPLAGRVTVVAAAIVTFLVTFVALVEANSLVAPSAGALAPRDASSPSDTFPCTEVKAPATDVCTYFHWGLETDPNVLGLFYVNGVLSEAGQSPLEFPTCAQDSPPAPSRSPPRQ
jgi:hypothetical protein